MHKYVRPSLSIKIFCMMNVATVCERSVPRSMILRQSGMISVWSKKWITTGSSTFTSAPTTPKEVSRRYSNERPFETVFKNGYRNKVMCAFKNKGLVTLCDATHWRRARTLQALLEVFESRRGGLSRG